MKATLLFDIDGTLALFHGQGRRAFEQAFSELFGVEKVWGDTNPHGRTDTLIFQQISTSAIGREMTADEFVELLRRYEHHFNVELEINPGFREISGAKEIIRILSGTGHYAMGVGTGNIEATAWAKLRHLGIDNCFLAGGFASDAVERVDILQTAQNRLEKKVEVYGLPCIVIGDTPFDIDAGKAIGARTIALTANGFSREQLYSHNPDAVIDDFSNILQVQSLIDRLAS